MRLLTKLMLLSALMTAAYGQDRHDWHSVSQLQPGDRVRLSLKTGPVEGAFQSWTPQEIRVATITAKREDVLKIERHRHGGSRGKHAAIGALIGFGGGFAVGASVTGCDGGFGPCFTRPQGGAVAGGLGAIIGALIGVALPTRSRELIYSAR